jgi:putative flippase GtrA
VVLQIVFLTELMMFASASVMGVGVQCIVLKAELRIFTVPNPVIADIKQDGGIRWLMNKLLILQETTQYSTYV